MISSRAVAETRNTGLGPKGRCAAQCTQARASAATASSDDATVTQFVDHFRRELLRRRFQRAQANFWIKRCLVRRVDAGEVAYLAGIGFLVKAFRITAGTFFHWRIHKDFQKFAVLAPIPGPHALVAVRRDERNQPDDPCLDEQFGDLSDAADVFDAVGFAETKITVQAVADVVAVE